MRYLFIFLGVLMLTCTVYATDTKGKMDLGDEIVIFNSKEQRKPILLGCQPCSARHGAMVKNNIISWTWEGKIDCWCGWKMEGLPVTNFDENLLKNYSLVIVYSGSHVGNPSPQVKFMDATGNATGLKDFSKYEKAESDKKVVQIPLSDFAMDISVDTKNIHNIQFDAGWSSSSGTIEISSITLKRN